jgi:hypothetical protein
MVNKLVMGAALALTLTGGACGKTIEKKLNDQIDFGETQLSCDTEGRENLSSIIVASIQDVLDKYDDPRETSCQEVQALLRGIGLRFVDNANDVDLDNDELTAQNGVHIAMDKSRAETEGGSYRYLTVTLTTPPLEDFLPLDIVVFNMACNFREMSLEELAMSEDSP